MQLVEEIRKERVNGRIVGTFRCYCGNVFKTQAYNVTNGHTRSCGCLLAGKKSSYSKTYRAWINMKSRTSKAYYPDYFGRGIARDPRWDTFAPFLADMGECPEGRSLDRIDVNGNYNKGNCRWATTREQLNNTRRNHRVSFAGVALTVTQWAEKLRLKPNSLLYRIRRGWDIGRALQKAEAKERKERRKVCSKSRSSPSRS